MHIKLTLRLSKGSMRKKKLKNLWSTGCYSWLISLVDLSFHLVSPKCQLKALFTSQLRVRDAQMGFRISESVCVWMCVCAYLWSVSLIPVRLHPWLHSSVSSAPAEFHLPVASLLIPRRLSILYYILCSCFQPGTWSSNRQYLVWSLMLLRQIYLYFYSLFICC